MKADSDSLRDLIGGVRLLAGASAPTEIFKRLLESMAPSVSVFLVRQGEICGWTSSGCDPASAQTQKNYRSPLNQGWLGQVAACDEDLVEKDPVDDYPPGRSEAVETVGGAVRVAGRPFAVLVFERAPGESPWRPEGLELLIAIARLQLELILLKRQSQSAAATTVATTVAPAAPAPTSKAVDRPQTEVAVDMQEPSEVEPAEATGTGPPEFEAARRYARLVATDIRLYNEEAVVLGRRNGDLAERLGEHLGRGEETFLQRHGDLGPVGLEILHDAYVQVLAGGDSGLFPSRPTPA